MKEYNNKVDEKDLDKVTGGVNKERRIDPTLKDTTLEDYLNDENGSLDTKSPPLISNVGINDKITRLNSNGLKAKEKTDITDKINKFKNDKII